MLWPGSFLHLQALGNPETNQLDFAATAGVSSDISDKPAVRGPEVKLPGRIPPLALLVRRAETPSPAAAPIQTEDTMPDLNTPSAAVPTIIGIGYQGLRPRRADRPTSGRGHHVVDVRLTPISRKPGLFKTVLRQALTDAGIGYRHGRELGNPKANRAGFAHPGPDRDEAIAVYEQLLSTAPAKAAIDELR